MQDYYKILGVKSSITCNEVKSVFRLQAQKLHPDKSGDPNTARQFIEAYEAYRILSNEWLRKEYDVAFTTGSGHDFTQDLESIRLDGEKIAHSSMKLFWNILFIIFIELMVWNRRLSIASFGLTFIGLATLVRGILNNALADYWIGTGLTAMGVFLGFIALKMLRQDYKEFLE